MMQIDTSERMYKVTGKVILKDTEIGIPNLLIVLYDLDDPTIFQQEGNKALTSIDSISTFSVLTTLGDEKFWQNFPGNRLGSVLTNEKGEFELRYENLDFSGIQEQDSRPDLILFVLAPEEMQSNRIPPLQRLLHFSYDYRFNSGQQESYIIWLSQEQLDHFQIPHPISGTDEPQTVESIAASLNDSLNFEQGVEAVLRQKTQEQLKPTVEAKKKADQAFKNFTLSTVSPAVRASETYFKAGEKIFDKLVNYLNDNLAKLPAVDLRAKRKLVLHLTEDQLKVWGLTASNGAVSGDVSLLDVVEYIRDTTGDGTLEYSRPVFENYLNEKEAERLFEEVLAKCRAHSDQVSDEPIDAPDTSDVSKSSELTTINLLHNQITRQMQHTTPPEGELKYGVEKNEEFVEFRKASPTDETAYHDFYELQIAFEHVWTEIFDKSIPSLLKGIYSEIVRYKNRISGIDEIPTVRDVRDMRDLYEDFIILQNNIESDSPARSKVVVTVSVPPNVKDLLPELTKEDWSSMTPLERTKLIRLAKEQEDADKKFINAGPNRDRLQGKEYRENRTRRVTDATTIFTTGKTHSQLNIKVTPPPRDRRGLRTNDRLKNLMEEMDQCLAEPHKFDIFAPNSINYGLMLTYRQKWVPKNYQVGEIVDTIPLAPKESRKYTTKQVIKKNRVQKEIQDDQSSRTTESSSTSRADNEITKQAREKTSFEQTASGTISLGVFQGQFGTRFGIEAEKSSSSTKKNFREAVLKAAEEYKQQRRLEVETSINEEIETTTSGEIRNPNDEITVTYLFCELQRQYEVSERIHRLTPVILVANDVPSPDEIDEDWLIAHDWILRRVILDDSFLPALSYVTTSIAGDELALQALREHVERQVNLLDELAKQVQSKTNLANKASLELQRLMETAKTPDDAQKLKDISMAIVFGPFSLAGGGGDDQAAEKREEIAKMALERADKDNQEVSAKLSREVTALQEAVDKYTRTLKEHFDRQTAIARLRVHIKENILYYMQAIWDYEPPDQRFFRLYNIEVPWIELQEATTAKVRASGRRVGNFNNLRFAPIHNPLYEVEISIPITYFNQTTKKLSQVANLDNLLGYKGNYMIFPVSQANYLHTYMMQDYIDPNTGGLRDPDEFSNYTTDELLEYACCLQKDDPEVFAEYREYLLNLVKKRMTTPRKESELVVVPTGSAYIEALPGKHPILEDFKLVHRALDVKKVQAEVRNAELENVRLAARLLEGEREDPDIDKRIIIEGNSKDIIVPPEA